MAGPVTFDERRLVGGELLWTQGEPAEFLAIVVRGELEVLVDERVAGRAAEGAMLGEVSVFIEGDLRRGTVRAVRPTTVKTLGRARLRALRETEPRRYDDLLAAALLALAGHVDQANRQILGRRADPPPAASPASSAASVHDEIDGAVPSADAAVRALLGGGAHAAEVAAVAAVLQAEPLQAGQLLIVEGADDRALYLLARGQVVVMRDDGAGLRELARLGAGALIGTGALVRAAPRNATVAATCDGFAWRLDAAARDSLGPSARRTLDEALLRALRGQLLGANALLARTSGPRGSLSLQEAWRAGGLEAWQAGDPRFSVQLSSLPALAPPPPVDAAQAALFAAVREAMIGADVALRTPFGDKRMIYADATASGRALAFIEDFLRDEVLPLYGSARDTGTATGAQTAAFREEARAAVAHAVGAGEDDVVLFVGTGATGAIDRLVDLLGLRVSEEFEARFGLTIAIPAHERPVVFLGPYEHHSNILPWRHCQVDVVTVPLDAEGRFDLEALELLLEEYADRPLRIGSFSAGSNVTGVATDVIAVSTLLHRYRALSFWDYGSAGPHGPIDMNPRGPGIDAALAFIDALALSPHKFAGGPDTPGVLVVKRRLVEGVLPSHPGAGTADYVTSDAALYSEQIERREEAGTPAIIGAIRCGLVFRLQDRVGAANVAAVEAAMVRRAIESWRANPAIVVLGNPDAERMSIVSLMIRHGGRFLHHDFVVALLNDVFGIQARGGSSSAGPYGAQLLGLDASSEAALIDGIAQGWRALAPGWTRLTFHYAMSEQEFTSILTAVQLIAIHGWALLPSYALDPTSGRWSHRRQPQPQLASLADLRFDGRAMRWEPTTRRLPDDVLDGQLEAGRALLETAATGVPDALEAPDHPADFDALRWFPLPHEVAAWQRHRAGAGRRAPSAALELRLQTYGALLHHDAALVAATRRALGISPEEHFAATEQPRG